MIEPDLTVKKSTSKEDFDSCPCRCGQVAACEYLLDHQSFVDVETDTWTANGSWGWKRVWGGQAVVGKRHPTLKVWFWQRVQWEL